MCLAKIYSGSDTDSSGETLAKKPVTGATSNASSDVSFMSSENEEVNPGPAPAPASPPITGRPYPPVPWDVDSEMGSKLMALAVHNSTEYGPYLERLKDGAWDHLLAFDGTLGTRSWSQEKQQRQVNLLLVEYVNAEYQKISGDSKKTGNKGKGGIDRKPEFKPVTDPEKAREARGEKQKDRSDKKRAEKLNKRRGNNK